MEYPSAHGAARLSRPWGTTGRTGRRLPPSSRTCTTPISRTRASSRADQVESAIANLYKAASSLGFPSSIGEFLDDLGGLYELNTLQQQYLQQYVPAGSVYFSITSNEDGTFNVFKTNTGPWAGQPWLSQSDDLTAQGQLTAQKTQVNLGSYQEAFYDQNSGSLVQLVSDTSTGKTVSDINSNGVTYDIAQYNTQDILQTQTITNSDNSKVIWTYNTGNPNVTSYAVNLNPQGQEAWQFDWNNNPATPFTIWQPNTAGSGNWLSRTVNFDSTMQAQTAVTNLDTGDWSETWWNPGSANWTSATIQYQGGSGNWEWQLYGYAPGNSVAYLNDLS